MDFMLFIAFYLVFCLVPSTIGQPKYAFEIASNIFDSMDISCFDKAFPGICKKLIREHGRCENMPIEDRKKCQGSCGCFVEEPTTIAPPQCDDTRRDCRLLASVLNGCEKFPEEFLSGCRKHCGNCPTCFDRIRTSDCELLKSIGECSVEVVCKDCPKTCECAACGEPVCEDHDTRECVRLKALFNGCAGMPQHMRNTCAKSCGCGREICQTPSVINSNLPQGKEIFDGDIVVYKCITGFNLEGAARWECRGSDSFTSQPAPRCEEKSRECIVPRIPNAEVFPKQRTVVIGKTVDVICNLGFALEGAMTLTCQSDGSFGTENPRCLKPQECIIPRIANAEVFPNQRTVAIGKTVDVICNLGFSLEGVTTLTCRSDGTFDSKIPQCLKKCKVPDVRRAVLKSSAPLEDGLVPFGATVTYSCSRPFQLSGSASITCSRDGLFKPEPPTCQRLCRIPNPDNAQGIGLTGTGVVRPGESVTFSCSKGFAMGARNATLTCQTNGKFKPDTISCLANCAHTNAPGNCDTVFHGSPPRDGNCRFPHDSLIYKFECEAVSCANCKLISTKSDCVEGLKIPVNVEGTNNTVTIVVNCG